MLLGSLPAGVLAVRAGPRVTVCTGLALLICSTVAFGLLRSVAPLDLARFVEGVGGACTWAGGIAWIVSETATRRRGAMLGRALGAAIGGALFGPVVGTVAGALGRPAVFCGLALISLLLIAETRRLPSHHAPSEQGLWTVARVTRSPAVAAGAWLVALPALVSGTISVLGSLRLARFGAGAAVVGATFLAAAASEAAITPLLGSLSDRRGRLLPLRGGLALMVAALLCFTLPSSVLLLAALIVLIATGLGAFWAPAMAMLSEAAEQQGVEQGLAAALMNIAWAAGQIIGAWGGGALARGGGDALTSAAAAGICALTLVTLWRGPRPAAAASGAFRQAGSAAPQMPGPRRCS
jgi:MFS family permease